MTNGNGNLPHHNLYINGQWRAPIAEHYRATTDPATGKPLAMICLLYTSDAADERSCVDLGGSRILKNKKQSKNI